jgi:hypothetical protein
MWLLAERKVLVITQELVYNLMQTFALLATFHTTVQEIIDDVDSKFSRTSVKHFLNYPSDPFGNDHSGAGADG